MRALAEQEPLLIFRVGAVTCCAPVRDVDSIVIPQPLNNIPGQSIDIAGVFQYRSHTVSVVKLHTKFGIPELTDLTKGRIIMAYTHHGLTGFWADDIEEITSGYEADFRTPPKYIDGNVFDKTLIWKDRMVLHTDFDRLYAMKDAAPLRSWMEENHISLDQASNEDAAENDNEKIVSLHSDAELEASNEAPDEAINNELSESDLGALTDAASEGVPADKTDEGPSLDSETDVPDGDDAIDELLSEQDVDTQDLDTHDVDTEEVQAEESAETEFDTEVLYNDAMRALEDATQAQSEFSTDSEDSTVESSVAESSNPNVFDEWRETRPDEEQKNDLGETTAFSEDTAANTTDTQQTDDAPNATDASLHEDDTPAESIIQTSELAEVETRSALDELDAPVDGSVNELSADDTFERRTIEPLSHDFVNVQQETPENEALDNDGNGLYSETDSLAFQQKRAVPIKLIGGVSALILVAAFAGYAIFSGDEVAPKPAIISVEPAVEETQPLELDTLGEVSTGAIGEITSLPTETMEEEGNTPSTFDTVAEEETQAKQDKPSELIPLETTSAVTPPMKPIEPQLPVWGMHVVSEGDTLWALATHYLNDPYRFPDLAKWSNISNPDRIYPGDNIKYRKDAKKD